jgi:outer membrane lipoprotein-sorting protein
MEVRVMWKRTVLPAYVLTVIAAMATSLPTQAQAPPPAQATTPATAQSPSVDEIVAKHLATKGGAAKWKSIQSQKMTGSAVSQGFQLAMTVYAKRPNLSRQELIIEVPGQPAMTIVNMFDGTKAWMINPMTGNPAPQAMPDEETATAKAQSDFDGALVDYKAKGYTVVLVEGGKLFGKPAHHLKVTRADLPTQHVYLDPETFVEMRVTTEGATASETDLSDYKAVEGIMVPHNIKISQSGAVVAELRIGKVEFNVPMDDALFRIK